MLSTWFPFPISLALPYKGRQGGFGVISISVSYRECKHPTRPLVKDDMKTVTSNQILDLLMKKHSEKFVCVPECKTGSSQYHPGHRVLDLWCMAKSWAKPRTIGYEIKVNRQDFLRDDKWQNYLDYCSEFYFAAPPGVIRTDELPPEVGFLESSKNVKVLYTKKKAPSRSVNIPENIFRYILMWRAVITNERPEFDRVAYWEDWLKKKDEKKELGRNVSMKVASIVHKKIKRVDRENHRLSRENERLADAKKILEELGIEHVSSWNLSQKLREKIHEINTGVSGDLLKCMEGAISNMQFAFDTLKEARDAEQITCGCPPPHNKNFKCKGKC